MRWVTSRAGLCSACGGDLPGYTYTPPVRGAPPCAPFSGKWSKGSSRGPARGEGRRGAGGGGECGGHCRMRIHALRHACMQAWNLTIPCCLGSRKPSSSPPAGPQLAHLHRDLQPTHHTLGGHLMQEQARTQLQRGKEARLKLSRMDCVGLELWLGFQVPPKRGIRARVWGGNLQP